MRIRRAIKAAAKAMRARDDELTRRDFLLVSATAAGGVLFRWPLVARSESRNPGAAALDDFIRIDPDNRVTIGARATEIGQGVRIALPVLIAEELDVRWEDVTVEPLPLLLLVTPQGRKLKVGDQGVGGSTSIPDAWEDHRKAGAQARARPSPRGATLEGAGPGLAHRGRSRPPSRRPRVRTASSRASRRRCCRRERREAQGPA